jgi:hypothetical protein
MLRVSGQRRKAHFQDTPLTSRVPPDACWGHAWGPVPVGPAIPGAVPRRATPSPPPAPWRPATQRDARDVGGDGERMVPSTPSSAAEPAAPPNGVAWVMLCPPLTDENSPLAVLPTRGSAKKRVKFQIIVSKLLIS